MTGLLEPGVERLPYHQRSEGEYESFGRGGAGNMSRSPSGSREGERGRPSDREHGEAKHGIAGLWNKVVHPAREN